MQGQDRGISSRSGLAALFEDTILLLVSCLPFFVPVGLGRNIDIQAAIVLLAGMLGWAAVFLRKRWSLLPSFVQVTLGIYLLGSLLSLLTHHTQNDAFGYTLQRLGPLVLIACVGCAFALTAIRPKRLVAWMYISITLLALATVPYSLWTSHQLHRPGGVFHQADFLAIYMACGLFLGLYVWEHFKRYRIYLIASQTLLAGVLLLTQTRAVIGLCAVLMMALLWQQLPTRRNKLLAIGVIMVLFVMGLVLQPIFPSRLTDRQFAAESVSYRVDLQRAALHAAKVEMPLGYGSGGIPKALACPTLQASSLQLTCHQGFYFDSSHDIYLDRILAFGWVVGVAYICAITSLIGWAIWQDKRLTIWSAAAILIGLYYLTNVTNAEVELLFWLALLMSTISPQKIQHRFFTMIYGIVVIVLAINLGWYAAVQTKTPNIQLLVNKQHPLQPLDYTPAHLVKPASESIAPLSENTLETDAAKAFDQMVSAAQQDGIQLMLSSGYRSYDDQQDLYSKRRDAAEHVAPPGFSEHQTGLAADIVTNNKQCEAKVCFDSTKAFSWLSVNSYKYGFILRYPKDKATVTGYSYEPWHYRYVGTQLAMTLSQKHQTLDEYYSHE